MLTSRTYEGAFEAAHHQNALLNINNSALGPRRAGVLGTMDKIQAHDEDTLGSGSGSGLSDLSGLENETDDFGRLILQHQRDARRMNSATRGGQRAFRKARPHPRIADRLTREERERGQTDAQHHERTSSGGSHDAEPPLNIPREWGRHARKQSDWLKKLKAPSENGDDDIRHRMNTHMSEAEDSVELGETTPPSMRRGHYSATPPSSLRHMNTTLRPFLESEDLDTDFTSNSFLTSTPAHPKYHRKIDDLARQEIEELENKAVTTRALDEIDQKSPNAVLRRTSSQRLRDRAEADGLLSPSMSPTIPPSKSITPSRIPVRNKENVPLHGEVNGSSKGSQIPGYVNRTAQPLAAKQLPKPAAHQRNDSMSLLRKLARVSSMSPSPGRDRKPPGTEKTAEPVAMNGKADGEYEHADSGNVELAVDDTPLPQDPPADAKTPVVTGAWMDTTIATETYPAPAAGEAVRETAEAETIEQILAVVKSEPKRPQSALDDIVREAKDHADAQNYGESTIQSLEDIVHPNVDVTDTSLMLDFGAKAADAQEEAIDDGLFTQAEKDRRQEQLAMEAMNKHLRTARTSIKDANRGLRRVENKIESVQGQTAEVAQITIQHQQTYGHVRCEKCGGGCYRSVWKSLWVEYRSNFYTWDANAKYGIRFTWLGFICLWFWIWYFSESFLCWIYCNPRYAYRVKHLPRWDAPEFPFTIPTLILRPRRGFQWEYASEWLADVLTVWFPPTPPPVDRLSERLRKVFVQTTLRDRLGKVYTTTTTRLREPFEKVFTSSGKVFAQTTAGLREPFSKAFTQTTTRVQSDWLASATAAAARVAYSVVDAVDEAGSMWDDEFVR